MRKKILCLAVVLTLVLVYVSAFAQGSYTWDMTKLNASDFTVGTQYTSIDNMISVKLNSAADISSSGIKAEKDKTKIKIVPIDDGSITVTFTGKAIMPDHEGRKSTDPQITSGEAITVTKGTAYYLQGSASGADAAIISAITYTSDTADMSLIVPVPKATSDPSATQMPSSTTAPAETPEVGDKKYASADMEFDNVWDLTSLTKDDYNKDDYVKINDVISLKADSSKISSKGVELSKNSPIPIIKIIPEADGQIMISFAGSVIFTDYEKRGGKEETISERELFDVYAGVPYYIQSSAGSGASVSAISFKANEFELFSVTGIGFSEDYTKVLEFDIEKGDDYAHDLTACICMYDSNGVLVKMGTKKILANSLTIGKNTVKCNIDISGYDKKKNKVKIFLWSGLDT